MRKSKKEVKPPVIPAKMGEHPLFKRGVDWVVYREAKDTIGGAERVIMPASVKSYLDDLDKRWHKLTYEEQNPPKEMTDYEEQDRWYKNRERETQAIRNEKETIISVFTFYGKGKTAYSRISGMHMFMPS
jgi:hypothetical protein